MNNEDKGLEGELFEDLEHVLASIGHALVNKGNNKFATFFAKSNTSIEFDSYDGWNGGTSVWKLVIALPYPEYISIDDEERQVIEKFIDKVIEPFVPDSGHWINSKITPIAINDTNWRQNITNSTPALSFGNEQKINLVEKLNQLVNLITGYLTGETVDEKEFSDVRKIILANKELFDLTPSWLKKYRTLKSLWGFIQPKYSTYAERRSFVDEEFSDAFNSIEFGKSSSDKPFENSLPNKRELKKVFIVHGRNDAIKYEVSRYIESLGLEAIILHEQVSGGKTIIEKIEHYASVTQFALILYTACDFGRGAHEPKVPPRQRARQNVVFEHGYLMAKLGRNNVCALVQGDIEIPNDISGVVYTDFDPSGAWKLQVYKELKDCGYNPQEILI
ncbi:TIR domain-containing protein [Pseudoalteromonas ostreae]|uniref:TIR domain-containing protein n=1 Tax=Pseudoalteromonas ostreae TaxID=2774154 RepID=UPI001B35CF61|nr:nucleotide-binding protein [Pseudoalteromonas ostreae]